MINPRFSIGDRIFYVETKYPVKTRECPECHGEGEVEHITKTSEPKKIICPICDGRGVDVLKYTPEWSINKGIIEGIWLSKTSESYFIGGRFYPGKYVFDTNQAAVDFVYVMDKLNSHKNKSYEVVPTNDEGEE